MKGAYVLVLYVYLSYIINLSFFMFELFSKFKHFNVFPLDIKEEMCLNGFISRMNNYTINK